MRLTVSRLFISVQAMVTLTESKHVQREAVMAKGKKLKGSQAVGCFTSRRVHAEAPQAASPRCFCSSFAVCGSSKINLEAVGLTFHSERRVGIQV